MMIPRCFKAIHAVLQLGNKLSKYDAAGAVFCDHRTAQRILTHMHVSGDVRICGWNRSKGAAIPVYCTVDGKKDVPKPAPIPANERAAASRLKAKKEPQPTMPKHFPTYGFWGI